MSDVQICFLVTILCEKGNHVIKFIYFSNENASYVIETANNKDINYYFADKGNKYSKCRYHCLATL